MNAELSTRASVWSRYWSSGALHSCAGSYGEAYAGPIGDFWRRAFLDLPPDARVLDIAAGNGPLERLMLDLPERPDLSCDAIDLAEVTPAWLGELAQPQLARVRFHSSCQAEELPFADASFDLVISQWGLEYSDLQRSLPELLRVLRPGGAVQLLLHHLDALPVQLAAEEIAHLHWLCQPQGFVDTAGELLEPMARSATPQGRAQLQADAQANALRQRYNALQDELQARLDGGSCIDVLQEARQAASQWLALSAARGEAAAREAWLSWQTALGDSMLRLDELRSHALDAAAAQALAWQLAGGADFRLETLRDRGQLMGWTLQLRPRR